MLIVLFFFGNHLFALVNPNELQNNFPQNILSELKDHRFNLIKSDVIKAFFYILITTGSLYLLQKKRVHIPFKTTLLPLLILIVGLADLWITNKEYLNNDNFVDSYYVDNPYPTNITDKTLNDIQKNPTLKSITGGQMENIEINKSLKDLKQKDPSRYRVLNLLLNPMSETHTSYFHNSLGGYHAVKIRRYQDLFDHYISKGNPEVINMLNTKYILQQNPEATSLENLVKIQQNPDSNGNSWLINEILIAENPDQELETLDKLNTKNQTVINKKDEAYLSSKRFNTGSNDSIVLDNYTSNHLTYKFNSNKPQFAVFSDIEYPGWQAYIDQEKVDHIRVNYLLRGLEIPAGKHQIEFKFEPSIIEIGKWISLGFYILFIIFIGVIFIADNRRKI